MERDLLGLPVRAGGLGFTDPVVTSSSEYEASVKVTNPVVRQIVDQEHQPPDTSEIRTLQLSARKQKDDCLIERLEQVNNSLPTRTKRAVELATEKGSSNWLTVIPLKELDYNLNKREFRDAIKVRYDWEITGTPTICAWGDQFSVDHAIVCRLGGFIIQRHNELQDLELEAEMLRMVCNDVEVELVLQEVTGETLNHGANKRKGESYSSAISWIRAKVSFAIVCSAILCLRGSRSRRRQLNIDSDLQIENIRACSN